MSILSPVNNLKEELHSEVISPSKILRSRVLSYSDIKVGINLSNLKLDI